MNKTLEFPITGLVVRPSIKTNLNFMGEVNSIFYNTFKALYKLKFEYPTKLQLVDIASDIIGEMMPQGRYFGTLSEEEINMFYFVSRQKSLEDFLFSSGHEEGHIIDKLNYHVESRPFFFPKRQISSLKKYLMKRQEQILQDYMFLTEKI